MDNGALNVTLQSQDSQHSNPGSESKSPVKQSDSLRSFQEGSKTRSTKKEKHEKDHFKDQLVVVPKSQKGKFAKGIKTPGVATTEVVKKGILAFMKDDKTSRSKAIKQKLYGKFKMKSGTSEPTTRGNKKRSLSELMKNIGRSKVLDIEKKPRDEFTDENHEDTVLKSIDYTEDIDSKDITEGQQ